MRGRKREHDTDRHGNPLPRFVYRHRRHGLQAIVYGAPKGGCIGYIRDEGDVEALADLGARAAAAHEAVQIEREAAAEVKRARQAAVRTALLDRALDELNAGSIDPQHGRAVLERLIAEVSR